MKLPSNIRFADEELKKAFYSLEKGDKDTQQMFRIMNQAIDNIEQNAFCGVQVPKKLIPKDYIIKYQIRNLWKYDLPRGWRLLYSVARDEIVVVSLILDWMDHKQYERKFKY